MRAETYIREKPIKIGMGRQSQRRFAAWRKIELRKMPSTRRRDRRERHDICELNRGPPQRSSDWTDGRARVDDRLIT